MTIVLLLCRSVTIAPNGGGMRWRGLKAQQYQITQN